MIREINPHGARICSCQHLGVSFPPSSAAPGSLGFILHKWWQNPVPTGSAELNGAFHPGRQHCHHPSSRSCTRRSRGLWILTPSAPPLRAEEHKRPRSRAMLLSEEKKKRETNHLQGPLGNLSSPACPNKQRQLTSPRPCGVTSLHGAVVVKSQPRNESQTNKNIANNVECGIAVDLLD